MNKSNPTAADILEQIGQIHGAFDAHMERQTERFAYLESAISDVSAKVAQSEIGRGVIEAAGTFAGVRAEDRNALRAVLRGQDVSRSELNADRPIDVRGALSTDSNPDGGYLIPETIDSQIRKLANDVGTIRNLAEVVSLGRGAGDYSRIVAMGGSVCEWTTERGSRPITEGLTFGGLSFPEGELYALPAATQRVIDDSAFDVVSQIIGDVALSFAAKEDRAFVSGDGVNKPRGFNAYDKIGDESWSWGKIGWVKTGVAAGLSDGTHNGVDALIDLVHSLPNEYRAGATFVMTKKTAAEVRKLTNETGDYLWQQSTQAGMPSTLLGYNVVVDPFVDEIGAGTYPIWFGNFRRGYTIIDRIGTRILRDPYSLKPYVLFYVTRRVGGGVGDFKALKALRVAA